MSASAADGEPSACDNASAAALAYPRAAGDARLALVPAADEQTVPQRIDLAPAVVHDAAQVLVDVRWPELVPVAFDELGSTAKRVSITRARAYAVRQSKGSRRIAEGIHPSWTHMSASSISVMVYQRRLP